MTYGVQTVWTYIVTGKRKLFSGLVQNFWVSSFRFFGKFSNKIIYIINH